ncbi:uncharacterized protein LOC127852554 [Dreissena polymorpha]|uniref:uncharacterized protein LOC127852554 n=1 Tax=Dreissena polymorpha TaxID=45954 RepID=UPI002264F315|nr:uncharacterized protein LOC127852554 [Dreissena polymorpha]
MIAGLIHSLATQLKVDALSEYPNDSFPAFCHGRAAIPAIITRGKDILDMPVFSETENKMMKSECIQIYTTSASIGEINASNTKQMDPVKHFCLEEQNMSCPVILIVEQEKKNIIEEWIETQNDNLHGVCVLLFSKGRELEQQYFSPEKGICLNNATLSDIMAAVDDILERSIFLVLKHLLEVYVEKYRATTDFSDVETESTLQSVYAFARAAYQRSEVPECERPNIPEKTYNYPNNIDEVITTLLTIEGVVGCSKKLGRLEISIDDTKDRKTIVEKVKLLLKNESIKATFVYGNFTYFLCPGDQVQGKKGKKGTLGGFAKRFATKTNMELNNRAETGSANQLSPVESTGCLVESTNTTVELNNREETGSASQSIPEESAGNLVALISRHVAYANMEMGIMHLLVNNKIIGHTDNIHPQTLLDIIPIDIYENLIGDCNTRFKTEQNKFMHAQLIDKEHISTLMGTKVHIWGAVSSPGLGTLVDIDFKMTGGLCIKVCDCINGKPFSYPGDSGAIVCASDSRGRNLYAIAMLIGKYEGIKIQPTYMAVLLSEAFQKLKELYKSEFLLCEDDGATL